MRNGFCNPPRYCKELERVYGIFCRGPPKCWCSFWFPPQKRKKEVQRKKGYPQKDTPRTNPSPLLPAFYEARRIALAVLAKPSVRRPQGPKAEGAEGSGMVLDDLLTSHQVVTCLPLKWVWFKMKQEGLRRFWSMFPLPRDPFWCKSETELGE